MKKVVDNGFSGACRLKTLGSYNVREYLVGLHHKSGSKILGLKVGPEFKGVGEHPKKHPLKGLYCGTKILSILVDPTREIIRPRGPR